MSTGFVKKTEPVMDRMFPDVVCPPLYPLESAEIFIGPERLPNIALLKEHFLKEGRVEEKAGLELISRAEALFRSEPNMIELQYPITVCGDVHGQFFDLVRLIEVGGDPKDTQYLFLGDYVDRGCFSTECVFYLYALKIAFPKTLFMLRGNHECRQLTSFFNFKDECSYKYDLNMYDTIMTSFDTLPIAAIVNNSFFCVHGGLSPDLSTLQEVVELDRFQEIPREGPMCDLLWADPYEEEAEDEDEGDAEEGGSQTSWFGYNETRQCSYVFGVEAVKQFLTDNKLTSIIRAHEAQVDGYKMHMVNKTSGIPRVITIFSAPNYCDVYKNKAACLKFDNNVLNIKQFIDSTHPYYLPNFMDVFQWSLPFVAEKVTDMLANILDFEDDGSNSEDEKKSEMQEQLQKKVPRLKKKVMAITRIVRIYKTLRQNNEAIVELKQLTPNNQIPFGLLHEGPEAIREAIVCLRSPRRLRSSTDSAAHRTTNTVFSSSPPTTRSRPNSLASRPLSKRGSLTAPSANPILPPSALSGFLPALVADEVNEHRPIPPEETEAVRNSIKNSKDPRRNSIVMKTVSKRYSAEKRASLPDIASLGLASLSPINPRGHIRHVKSEDLSHWSPATPEEPAFKLTPTFEEGEDAPSSSDEDEGKE